MRASHPPVLRPSALALLLLAAVMQSCHCNPGTPLDDAGGSADGSNDGSGDGIPACVDALCQNQLFCDGVEACNPGAANADLYGCAPAANPACAPTQICDETADTCTTVCSVNPDADGDGEDATNCGGTDCDDSNIAINTFATDTNCDNVDDDCSGVADDAYAPVATNCGVGACAATGSTSCVTGVVIDSCAAGVPAATDATCDGIDDNCNSVNDEAYAPSSVTCGVGACRAAGVTDCVAGSPVSMCTPGTPAATDTTCDDVDDDCNGTSDDGYVPTATTCGVGACASTGTTACVAGALTMYCTPGTPRATDATCDGIDDNCDGTSDEGYVSVASSCGVGACAAAGATSCVGGVVTSSCVPGVAAASDTTCDGIDDNCDGTSDEGYVSGASSCGVGACAATGATSCVGGAVVDSCAPGAPSGNDRNCNGIDEDCDGVADDDYASIGTSCGVGACAATGATSCVAGVVVDSCTIGIAAATDATCDGIDDNCDGASDEGYVSTATSCGQGVCGATGATSCVAGAVLDSCVAGAPTGNDRNCNGLDEDCDGTADDGFNAAPTSCGIGACASTGVTSCAGGVVSDSCVAGAAAASDLTCDGIDDNCDGATDEG